MRLVQNNSEIETRSETVIKQGERVNVTHKDVQMVILNDIRSIAEVKVSYTKNSNGTVSRCMSFGEYNRIADEIHRQLRARRKVYSERE